MIYHEYLHHVLGPHHNRRFHQHERQFRYHRESQEWIRRNLFLLLGRKKSERPAAVAAGSAEAVQAWRCSRVGALSVPRVASGNVTPCVTGHELSTADCRAAEGADAFYTPIGNVTL